MEIQAQKNGVVNKLSITNDMLELFKKRNDIGIIAQAPEGTKVKKGDFQLGNIVVVADNKEKFEELISKAELTLNKYINYQEE